MKVTRRAGVLALGVLLPLIATVVPASATEWDEGAGPEWAALLEKARAEGAVVIAGSPALAGPFVEAFTADTGIAVDLVTGGFRDLRIRFERELETDNPTIDVHFGGSSGLRLKAEGLLAPVKPMLVLPNATDPANWQDGDPGWLDTEREYVVQPSEYTSGRVFVNSDIVDVETVKTWRDLLRPEFKGKIASYDISFSGAGQALSTYLLDELGPDFVLDLYKGQDVRMSRDSRQLVEWLVRGSQPIALGVIAVDVERYREAGVENIAVLEMEDAPGYVVGGSAVAVSPRNPPHPNAAAVFHNWLLTSRGQQLYVNALQVPSRRTDVDNSPAPDFVRPTPGITYESQYSEQFYTEKRTVLRKQLEELMAE